LLRRISLLLGWHETTLIGASLLGWVVGVLGCGGGGGVAVVVCCFAAGVAAGGGVGWWRTGGGVVLTHDLWY